jgi:hypothetical protein
MKVYDVVAEVIEVNSTTRHNLKLYTSKTAACKKAKKLADEDMQTNPFQEVLYHVVKRKLR